MPNLKISRGLGRYSAQHSEAKGILSTQGFFILFVAIAILVSIFAATTIGYANVQQNNNPINVDVSQSKSTTLYAPDAKVSANSYQWQIYVPQVDEFVDILDAKSDSLEVDSALLKNALDKDNNAQIKAQVLNSEGEEVRSQVYLISFIDDVDESSLNSSSNLNNSNSLLSEGGTTIKLEEGNVETDSELVANETKKVTVNFVDMNGIEIALPNINEFEVVGSVSRPFVWAIQLKDYLGIPQSDIVVDPTDALETSLSGEDNVLTLKSTTGISTDVNVTIKFKPGTANYYIDCYYETPEGTYPLGAPSQTFTNSGPVDSEIPVLSDFATCHPEPNFQDSWEITAYDPAQITQDGSAHCTIAYGRLFSLIIFNTNGGVNGPKAIFARYGSNYTEQPCDPKMAGYNFKGWYDNPGFTGDPITEFTTIPHVIPTGIIYYAKFVLDPELNRVVNIVYWGENANADTQNFDKSEYSYISEQLTYAPVNSTFNLTNDLVTPPAGQTHTTDEWLKLYKCSDVSQVALVDKDIDVKPDNTAICNVYLYRTTFTWHFYRDRLILRDIDYGKITAKWDEDIYDVTNPETARHYHGDKGFKQICQEAYGEDSGPWEIQSGGPYTNMLTNMSTENHDSDMTGAEFGNYEYASWLIEDKVDFRYYTQDVDADYSKHKSIETGGTQEGFTLFKTSKLTDRTNLFQTFYFTDDEYIPILGFKAPNPDGLNGPKTDGSTRTGGVDGGYSVYYIRNTHNVYLNRLVSDDHPDEYYETLSNVHYEKKLGDIPVPDSVPGYFTDESDKTLKNFVPYNPGSQYIDSNLVFAGWTFDQNGLGDVVDLNSQYLPDNSVNLYAKWEAPKVDVKFVWPQSAQNPEIEEPSGTVLLEDQVYGTYLDPLQIPAVRDFAGSGYEFIARYYYDTPEDKAAGIKTYFHPKEMTVPAHDIEIYTEYTRADIARYTVQYKLKKTSPEEDDVFVAADRTGVGYIGDTVTVYPKQTDELYFDYRSFYLPIKTSDTLVMAQDPTENIIIFEYELSPSASLDYTVYYLNNRLIDPSKPDVIPDEAIIEKQEVKDHKYNFVTLEAKEFAGFDLSDDCADTQTTLLGADASKNIVKFYYDEQTVTLTYKIKLNGTVEDPSPGEYSLDVYSQEVYSATNEAKLTSEAPASTATCVSPYEFVGWTDADDKTLTTTNTLNPTIAEGEVWEENATFYANFTNASSLIVTMKVADGQEGYGSLTNYTDPFTVSANSGYTMNGTTITFHGTATEEKSVVATPTSEGSYAFAYWTVEGDETHYFISNGSITESVTVVAHFVNDAITVTFDNDEHCTLSFTGNYKVPSGTKYVANDNGTFEIPGYVSAITATPSETYKFASWSITPAVSVLGTFNESCTVKPVAEIIKYHLTFVSSTSNRGKVDTDSYDAPANSLYTINTDKTLTITPSDGSSAVTVGFKDVLPGFECNSWVVNPPFETAGTISHDAKFAASFDYITFDLSFSANPADKGDVSKSSLNVPYGTRYRLDNNNDLIFEYPYEKTPDNVTKNAKADSHYHFVNWTVDGEDISSGELTKATSFVANFDIDKFNVKLKPNNSSMGKVDNTDLVSIDVDYGSIYKKASSGNGLFVVETEHSPNANEHHSFIKWLDDNGSDLTEGDHQVTKDIVLTAVFDIDKYTLTFNKGSASGGHMERNGSQIESHTIDNVPYGTQYYQDTFGTIHVSLASGEDSVGEVADEGYLVDGWTQKIGEAEASDVDYKEKYTVTDNTEFKSYFKLMELRVICTIQGEYKDEGGTLDYTESFKEKYGTPYAITDDGHTGLDCKSSSITFTNPETNEDFVVTATANEGYFWDGWYISYEEKEQPNGKITKEKVFCAVFWKVNDSKYMVRHHMQNVDDDGNLVTDQTLWPVVSEEVPCTTGAKRTPDYCPHDGYTAITLKYEQTVRDWDLDPDGETIWDYYYTLNDQKYTLTVNYHVPDGYEAPASVEKSLYYTARYSVPSPNIDGLVVDTPIVEGSMPLNNLIVDVDYAVPPSPDNPENYNAQTGDSNFWMIIGLIAIFVVAGGVTYVVARKRKNYKPKYR